MEKILYTTENLPEGTVVQQVFGMIQFTGAVEVSKKGMLRGFLERKRNEYQEVVDAFVSAAPEEANAILGVQVSTSTQQFSNGTFMYITYTGTPAILKGHSVRY